MASSHDPIGKGKSKVVNKVVERVGFSFYDPAEVRAISLKQIISPILLNHLEKPVPGGLYDPALGPLEQYGRCVTCGEVALQCPGHFGHIDLALPVYNPLVFSQLVKILKHACLFCHHFKMHKKQVRRYADQLEVLYKGYEVEASKANLDMVEDDTCPTESSLESGNKSEIAAYRNEVTTSVVLSQIKDLLKRFMEDMPKKKCANCEAFNPALRSEGVGKIFQSPLQKSKLTTNIQRGLRLDLASIINNVDFNKAYSAETVHNSSDIEVALNQDKDRNSTIEKGSDVTTLDSCSQLRYLTAFEVRVHINRLWNRERHICSLIWGSRKFGNEISNKAFIQSSDFFLEAVLVPPNRFRPPNRLQDALMEHPMNILYTDLIQANMNLVNVLRDGSTKSEPVPFASINSAQVTSLWLSLQNCINKLIDSSTAIGRKSEQNGIRQILEKKDGLFRMNLMGKRVNYSCRSVISPDPYIAVNEIGIPPYFATRLTYPEKVTHWNIHKLREAVANGPSIYPGATHVEDELGVVVSLNNLSRSQRLAISKTLLSTPSSTQGSTGGGNPESVRVTGKIVYRHLEDGDVLLVNRQPTLHKPSMMGHIARVLKGEKTLRLHYANCSTYNADFDGDEMNVHFPQDEVARAEAYQIVNANQQYVGPTSGTPLRGLIQIPRKAGAQWEFVDKIKTLPKGNSTVKCKFCGHTWDGGANRIRAHLLSLKGYGVGKCDNVPQHVKDACRRIHGKVPLSEHSQGESHVLRNVESVVELGSGIVVI